MPFQKTSVKTKEKIEAIERRLVELKGDLSRKQESLSKAKEEVQTLLGQMAMGEGKAEDLKESKRGLERSLEVRDDLTKQIAYLEDEKIKLGKEYDEAKLKDFPTLMEQAAESFNVLLKEALDCAEVLEGLHRKMLALYQEFFNLETERRNILQKLGRVEGLSLKIGLGTLHFVSSPYFGRMEVGENFSGFLGQLMEYKRRVLGHENFMKNNPQYQENLEQVKAKESKSYEWSRIHSLPPGSMLD